MRRNIVYNRKFNVDFRYLFLAPINFLRRSNTNMRSQKMMFTSNMNGELARPWVWGAAQQMDISGVGVCVCVCEGGGGGISCVEEGRLINRVNV